MRKMSVQRRKAVLVASSVAAMSGAGPVLLRGHRGLLWGWLGVQVVLTVWALVLVGRLKGSE